MRLSKLAEIVGGKLAGAEQEIDDFFIDGRKTIINGCYFALIGERFDGHDFIAQAKKNGAVAAVVSKKDNYGLPVIVVEDTQQALTKLSGYHREQFNLPVVALTGSCGKTTVKEMLRSILPEKAFVTEGNLNNHIGLPLSLLSLNAKHSHAVFELGASQLGDIGPLAKLAKPDVSLITNIAPAHLEGFGTIEGVAKTKGEIFAALDPAQGLAVINLDDQRVLQQAQLQNKGRKKTFSLDNPQADVFASNVTKTAAGCYQFLLCCQAGEVAIKLNVPGLHNVRNALAAATVGISLGFSLTDIKLGLEKFKGVGGRLAYLKGLNNATLIDDTYNANLHSVKAAIDVLSQFEGHRILVLGELAEVGDELLNHYQAIGEYASARNVEALYTYGKKNSHIASFFSKTAKHFSKQDELIAALKDQLSKEVIVLVKGSRSAQMEKVITGLTTKRKV